MKTSFAVAAILSILALAAPSASTQQMRSFQCIATSVTPGASHITIYVSQLIPMELSEHTALAGAWATYIKATYHTATISSTSCQPFGMNSTIQEQALAAEETAWKRQGWDVVHVTWRPGQAASSSAASIYSAAPGPGGAATPPPAPAAQEPPPASTGPEPRASYCFSDEHKPTIYLSDPFDTAGLPSGAAWSTAFTKFLAQKYTYKGAVICKNAATIVAVQSVILDQRNNAWQNKQIIDTDWTYEPPAPGDEAPDASGPPPTHH